MPDWILKIGRKAGGFVVGYIQKRIIKKLMKEVLKEADEFTDELEVTAFELGVKASKSISKVTGKVGLPSLGDKEIEPRIFRVIDSYQRGMTSHKA